MMDSVASLYPCWWPAGSACSPTVRLISDREGTVWAQIDHVESFRTAEHRALPPVTTNRTSVEVRDSIDLHPLLMVKMSGEHQLHVRSRIANRINETLAIS